MCRLKMKDYAGVCEDCDAVLGVEPDNVKVRVRVRGKVRIRIRIRVRVRYVF